MKIILNKILQLPDFPSASALEWQDGKLYVIGDDATHILVLDGDYNLVEKINLFPSVEKRIPKKIKPDLEAATIVSIDGEANLLLVGSGSKDAERDVVKLVALKENYDTKTYITSHFFAQVRNAGVAEINIEGATIFGEQILLANRGNKTNPGSLLIKAPIHFWETINAENITINQLILPDAAAGISGLETDAQNDLLLFTASKEETLNAFDDGAIGDSFIGWVANFSSKINNAEIMPDAFINLTQSHPSFQGKKIESICLESAIGNLLTIHLCADNDDGESTLFKITLEFS
jgi:hypothetical protein